MPGFLPVWNRVSKREIFFRFFFRHIFVLKIVLTIDMFFSIFISKEILSLVSL